MHVLLVSLCQPFPCNFVKKHGSYWLRFPFFWLLVIYVFEVCHLSQSPSFHKEFCVVNCNRLYDLLCSSIATSVTISHYMIYVADYVYRDKWHLDGRGATRIRVRLEVLDGGGGEGDQLGRKQRGLGGRRAAWLAGGSERERGSWGDSFEWTAATLLQPAGTFSCSLPIFVSSEWCCTKTAQ